MICTTLHQGFTSHPTTKGTLEVSVLVRIHAASSDRLEGIHAAC